VLRRGDYVPLTSSDADVLSYARRLDGEQMTVVANFSGQPKEVQIADAGQISGRVIISSLRPMRTKQ